MHYCSSEKKILDILYRSQREINIYKIHEEFQFSPAQFSVFIRKYEEMNIIIMDGDNIILTKQGKEWILNNRKKIFLTKREEEWIGIPDEWKLNKNGGNTEELVQ